MINKVLNEPVYDDDAVNKKYVDKLMSKIKENNVYSTEETIVGIWIDGKPIYRRVNVLTPEFIRGDNYYPIGIENIDTVVSSTLHFKYNSKWYITWDGLYNKEYLDGGARYLVSATSALTLQYLFLISEYTKTTD